MENYTALLMDEVVRVMEEGMVSDAEMENLKEVMLKHLVAMHTEVRELTVLKYPAQNPPPLVSFVTEDILNVTGNLVAAGCALLAVSKSAFLHKEN